MIAVTGGAGFIGSNLVRRLLSEGHDILVVDNLSTGKFRNIKDLFEEGRIEMIKQDIAELGERAFRDVEAVFHFAAYPFVRGSDKEADLVFRSNILGTFKVLEACRRNDCEIVFASSSTVYGIPEKNPVDEESRLDPISNYGASKAAGEMLVRSYHHTYGIRSIILRYANIFGPPSDKGVVHDFVRKLQNNPEVLEIFGDGSQTKSYLWIEDAVEGTVTAWRKGGKMDVFNVGSDEFLSVREIADEVSSAMGLEPDYKFLTEFGSAGWKGDIPRIMLDSSRLKSLGWEPKMPAREGIRRYVQWLLENPD